MNPVNSALRFINNIINDTCLNPSVLSYLFYWHEERTIVHFYLLAKNKDFSNNPAKPEWFCSLGKSHVFPEEQHVISVCSQNNWEWVPWFILFMIIWPVFHFRWHLYLPINSPMVFLCCILETILFFLFNIWKHSQSRI